MKIMHFPVSTKKSRQQNELNNTRKIKEKEFFKNENNKFEHTFLDARS